MIRLVATALALGVVYSATLASGDPVDLAAGTLLAAALLVLLGRRLEPGAPGAAVPVAQRVVWFPVFAGAVLADIVQGTADVLLRVVHVRRLEHPGLVRVPIGPRSERGVAVSALATTLSPGTVLVDVDWDRGELLLHVIDASDPDGVRARLERFYERYQRRVFP